MSDEKRIYRYDQPKVIIESPFHDDDGNKVSRNVAYARACLEHSLGLGEMPFAGHLIYPMVLNDDDPDERRIGMRAGLTWMEIADYVAVYTDLGISPGMKFGIEEASIMGKRVEFREIPDFEQKVTYHENRAKADRA